MCALSTHFSVSGMLSVCVEVYFLIHAQVLKLGHSCVVSLLLCVALDRPRLLVPDLRHGVDLSIRTFVFLVQRKLGSLVWDRVRAGFGLGGIGVSSGRLLLLLLLLLLRTDVGETLATTGERVAPTCSLSCCYCCRVRPSVSAAPSCFPCFSTMVCCWCE